MVKLAPVAPEIGFAVSPAVPTYHCSVGVGLPAATTLIVAVAPTAMLWLAGFVVNAGAIGSSLVMEPMPCASLRVATPTEFTTLLRLTKKVSVGSPTTSPLIVTLTV